MVNKMIKLLCMERDLIERPKLKNEKKVAIRKAIESILRSSGEVNVLYYPPYHIGGEEIWYAQIDTIGLCWWHIPHVNAKLKENKLKIKSWGVQPTTDGRLLDMRFWVEEIR